MANSESGNDLPKLNPLEQIQALAVTAYLGAKALVGGYAHYELSPNMQPDPIRTKIAPHVVVALTSWGIEAGIDRGKDENLWAMRNAS